MALGYSNIHDYAREELGINASTAVVINSTISGNRASTEGGGIERPKDARRPGDDIGGVLGSQPVEEPQGTLTVGKADVFSR